MVSLGVRSAGRPAETRQRRGSTLASIHPFQTRARACGVIAPAVFDVAGFLDRRAGILDIAGAVAGTLKRMYRAGGLGAGDGDFGGVLAHTDRHVAAVGLSTVGRFSWGIGGDRTLQC